MAQPRLALTLLACAAAGLALWRLGGPAPFIVASVIVSALMNARGWGARPPRWLADSAFCATGFAMGMGVDRASVAEAALWPASLVLLLFCLLAIIATSSSLLRLLRGCDRDTALLSAIPGALSYVLALGERRGVDMREVSLIQGMRLIALVVGLPLILGGAQTPDGNPPLAPLAALAGFGCACAGGLATARMGLAGGVFLGALGASAALSLSGALNGAAPLWLTAPAFTVMGAFIGSNFRDVRRGEMLRAAGSMLVVVTVAAALSAGFAAAASLLVPQPFGALWTAYAPGGAEAMGAVGLALGYDPGFVAAHHMARMAMLAALTPLLLGRRAQAD